MPQNELPSVAVFCHEKIALLPVGFPFQSGLVMQFAINRDLKKT
ncbi:hypothetical protein [Flavobacterium macacae]|nr:hypothetical protein [Flavobacterium macacae]